MTKVVVSIVVLLSSSFGFGSRPVEHSINLLKKIEDGRDRLSRRDRSPVATDGAG